MAAIKKARPKEEKVAAEAKEEVKEPTKEAKEAKETKKEVHVAHAHAPVHEAAHAPVHHEAVHAPAHEAAAHAEHAHPPAQEAAPVAPVHPKKEKKEAAVEKEEKKAEKAAKKVHVPKTRHSKKAKLTLSKGKRKRAIARVIIQQGKGIIRINKVLLEATPNKYYKQLIREVIDITGPRINEVNIDALVTGGGNAGQMQAVRTAIASGLVDYFNDDSLARALEEHGGRTMIVNDTRRVEPKKYRGPKARARYQKSYR